MGSVKTVQLIDFNNERFQGTLYEPDNQDSQLTLVYFHGGGFIFGEREDLPKPYIDLLNDHHISILSVDYPLAPEYKLEQIIDYTKQLMTWLGENLAELTTNDKYFIMGRSAGGFLALHAGVSALELNNQPKGIISLYGYFSLRVPHFTIPNRHYLQYPKIDQQIVDMLLKRPELPANNRYTIYMYGRQTGNWLDMVLEDRNQAKALSLSEEDVEKLPPLFLAAANNDPDIPANQSRKLDQIHDNSTLQIIDSSDHDFDRTQVDHLGMPLYQDIVEWIKNQI